MPDAGGDDLLYGSTGLDIFEFSDVGAATVVATMDSVNGLTDEAFLETFNIFIV